MTTKLSKLSEELLQRIGFDVKDYFNVLQKMTPETLCQYLEMAAAVGFDEGIKFERAKHANNMQKAVVIIDRFGNVVERCDSFTDAGKVLGVKKNTISSAIKKGHFCKGHIIRLA